MGRRRKHHEARALEQRHRARQMEGGAHQQDRRHPARFETRGHAPRLVAGRRGVRLDQHRVPGHAERAGEVRPDLGFVMRTTPSAGEDDQRRQALLVERDRVDRAPQRAVLERSFGAHPVAQHDDGIRPLEPRGHFDPLRQDVRERRERDDQHPDCREPEASHGRFHAHHRVTSPPVAVNDRCT
jgi:hypothetical protein